MPLDAIGRVIHQLEQQPTWRSRGQFRQILDHWPALVGAVVARQAVPVRLTGSVLSVAVVNPMWAQTLTMERLTILTKLNQQLQLDLTDLRFSSGEWFRRSSTSATPAAASSTSVGTLPDWLRRHPSFEPGAITASPSPAHSLTALESFQRWAALAQGIANQRVLCPDCRCPCPPGELSRWSRCSVCAAQRFGRGAQAKGGRPQ
jgi:predicted nucleic acid-binding Zn ribbon protein